MAVERQGGAVVDVPGETWSKGHAFLVGIVDFRIHVADHPGKAIQKSTLFVERAAKVEGTILAIMATRPQFDRAQGFGCGAL
ncbi:hypothetical protein D3C80_1611380 [compost metagenome]